VGSRHVTGVDLPGALETGAKFANTLRVDVVGHDRNAAACERHRDRHADVAETDERNTPSMDHPFPP
jgi:hypothetical protein